MNPFLAEIYSWVGTPFHWHQRTKGAEGACDCVGLIHGAMIEIGILPTSYEFSDYGNHNPDITEKLESLGEQYIKQIPAPIDGCIVSFRVRGDIQHLGVKDGDRLIHSHQRHGVIVDEWAIWQKRAYRFYRVK